MSTPVVSQESIDQMVRFASKVKRSGDKIAFNGLASGMRAVGTLAKKEMKRSIQSFGLGGSVLHGSIISTTKSSRNKGTVRVAAGARNQKVNGKNPAKYSHLVNNGTKRHFQADAWRPRTVNGRSVLVKIEGGAWHPGSKAQDFRGKALIAVQPKAEPLFQERYERRVFRDLEKAKNK